MIVELQIFKYRIVLTAAKTEVIEGVYSLLDNDMHFLMWDFDNTTAHDVYQALETTMKSFNLARIYIFETKRDEGYHAYCLNSVTFKRACEIIASTEGVDMRFFTAGVTRKKWTLRLSDKSGRCIKPINSIPSLVNETVKIEDIKRYCHYKTPGDGHKTRIIKLGGD